MAQRETKTDPKGRLEWMVDSAGYELGKPATDVLMRPSGEVRQAVKRRYGALQPYYPEDVPDLYRRFVGLPDDEGAVLDFVTRYGFLGINVPREWDEHLQQWNPRPEQTAWESIEALQNHRDELAALVDYLEDVLTEEGRAKSADRSDGPRLEIAALFTQRAPASFSVRVTPVERGGGRLGVAIQPRPTTLLAAMWGQVADAIYTGLLWRSCEICGSTFQVGKGAGRMSKLTCSTRCQSARQRRRARED